uniref:Helicase ATP-binding domain-containing protein n=1 Tax=Parastrongyloides trichosuri TaxID=131310 RepID=A0A0N4ZFL3_PARTI
MNISRSNKRKRTINDGNEKDEVDERNSENLNNNAVKKLRPGNVVENMDIILSPIKRELDPEKKMDSSINKENILGDDEEYTESEYGPESSSSDIEIIEPSNEIHNLLDLSYQNVLDSIISVEEKTYRSIDAMLDDFKNFDEYNIKHENSKIKTKLMYNQKKNLNFMIHRERYEPYSGILADDMGLGKSLSILALVLHQKDNDFVDFDKKRFMDRNVAHLTNTFFSYVESRATLIVVPGIVLKQWQDEIKKHIKKSSLKYKVYDPRHTKTQCEIEDLLNIDIVFTTYDIVKAEYRKLLKYETLMKKYHLLDEHEKDYVDILKDEIVNNDPVLPGIFFRRVVLDEVHAIKRSTTLLARSCHYLNGIRKWAITGTPIQNSMNDLYSIIKFLKISPFDMKTHFNFLTTGRSDRKVDYFNNFIKCILIRNEKDLIDPETHRPILDVPTRNVSDVHVSLGGIERRCYERMYFGFRKRVAEVVDDILEKKGKFGHARRYKEDADILNPFLVKGQHIDEDGEIKMSLVLSLTTRLRQACSHMHLVSKVVDMDRLNGVERGEEVTEYDEEAIISNNSTRDLEDEKEKYYASATSLSNVFSPFYQSPKVRAVLEKVKIAIMRKDKCIIVSQWTQMLDIFAKIFEKQKVPYLMISGRDPIPIRDERIDNLNNDPDGPKICLLSLLASGTGVNLTGANHMFLVDLFWNPSVEKQCFDRIYRFGQTKETFVYRFICDSSIEERVMEIQEKKNKLSMEVLHQKIKRSINGYDIHDIRQLWKV